MDAMSSLDIVCKLHQLLNKSAVAILFSFREVTALNSVFLEGQSRLGGNHGRSSAEHGSIHQANALLVSDVQCALEPPRLAFDPAFDADRSPFNQILKGMARQQPPHALGVQRRF